MTDEAIRIALAQLRGYRRIIHEAQYFFQAPGGTRWLLYQELPDWLHDPASAGDLDELMPPGQTATTGREKAECVLRARGLWRDNII